MDKSETFETSPLTLSFTGDWEVSTVSPHSGTKCYRSKAIKFNESSSTETKVTISDGGGKISFWYRVSCSNGDDWLSFYVDDNAYLYTDFPWGPMDGVTGEIGWTQVTYDLPSGEHTLKWQYLKGSVPSIGQDAGFIDDIVVTNAAGSAGIKSTFTFDTSRRILPPGAVNGSFNFDTKRSLGIRKNLTFDSKRVVTKTSSLVADTSRKISNQVSFEFDTKRGTGKIVLNTFDTKRIAAANINRVPMKNLNIQTSTQSLSDQFSAEFPEKPSINIDTYVGEVAGFKFSFEKAETTESRLRRTFTVRGRPDMADFLFRPVNLTLDAVLKEDGMGGSGYVVNKTAKQLCEMVGVDASNITDFTPTGIGNFISKSVKFEVKERSLKGFLDRLFGWSSEMATRQMYYFNRNGKVFVSEVGKYKTVYNLDDEEKYRIEDATVNQKQIRKFYELTDTNGDSTSYDQTTKKNPGKVVVEDIFKDIPLSGTISFGGSSLSYSNGLLMRESSGDSTTTYDYTNRKISRKYTVGSGSRSTTTYSYSMIDGQSYLAVEHVKNEKANGNAWEVESEHYTYHVPLGDGFFGQRVEEVVDGIHKTVSSSVSRGCPGGEASTYTVKRWNGFKVTVPNPAPDAEKVNDLQGPLVNRTNIPIAEISLVNGFIDLINWLDKKTEETVTISAILKPDTGLIDAVNGAIQFEGHLYYMRSAAATVNEKGIRQQITAVRWF